MLKFTDDLLLGVEDLDRHHRVLFEHARMLLDTPEGREEARELRLLDFLNGYIRYHFAAEESAINKAGLEVRKHKVQHERLSKEVRALLQSRRETGTLTPPDRARLRILIEDWLANHIRTWDAGLVGTLRKGRRSLVLPLPDELVRNGSADDLEVVDIAGEISRYEIAARRRAWK
jgi:hemerythrin